MDTENTKAEIWPPVPQTGWALFLDIDGTLLDIAPRPDAVVVPADLPAALESVSTHLGGALAIASGRSLTAIDQLLAPLKLPCAAEHGALLRMPDGTMLEPAQQKSVPAHWREQIRFATRGLPGILVGNKVFSVVVHYRLAPEWEEKIRVLLQNIVASDPEFEVLPARMAFEVRHRTLNKGAAIRQIMTVAPFAGRLPVFVGDDVTDEDGFRAVCEMGGLRLHVDEAFHGRPANVRAWLQTFAP